MNFVKSLAKQLGPEGIRVNGVAPGPVWTPLQVSGGASEGKVVTFGATAPLAGPAVRAPANVGAITMRNRGSRAAVALAPSLCCGGALAQTAIPPSPRDFAAMASQSDHYETLAGEVALIQGQDPRVRAFAETMLRDHTRTAEDFRKAAMAAGLPPPPPGPVERRGGAAERPSGRAGEGLRPELFAPAGCGPCRRRRRGGKLRGGGRGPRPADGGAGRPAGHLGSPHGGPAAREGPWRRGLSPKRGSGGGLGLPPPRRAM